MSEDELYIGEVLRRCKYKSNSTGKIVDGYEVRWVLDGVIECMTYSEVLQGSRDYDEWIDAEQCESDVEDDDGCDSEPKTKTISIVDTGCVDVTNVMDVDDDDLRDHCRELMILGECDEQYHSDDESFIMGGDGDKSKLD